MNKTKMSLERIEEELLPYEEQVQIIYLFIQKKCFVNFEFLDNTCNKEEAKYYKCVSITGRI
jgi:hypothetical protein